MSAIVKYLLGPGWPWVRLLLYLVGICAFVGANAAYLVLAERKGAGRIQRGPDPMRPGTLAGSSPWRTASSSSPSRS